METRQPKDLAAIALSAKMKTFTSFVNLVVSHVTDPEAYKDILHEEVMFFEYPNLVTKKGQVRNSAAASKGIEVSKSLLKYQRYEYLDWFENDDRLMVEATWNGVLAIDAGHLRKDDELNAHMCFVIEFKDGKIFRQRNYDCYEPFYNG